MRTLHTLFRLLLLWVIRVFAALRRHWVRTLTLAVPLVVAVVVVADARTGVKWGNVGEWAAGIGALSAALVALWSQRTNHLREQAFRNEDRQRWEIQRSEDQERWDVERQERREQDLAERADRASTELKVSSERIREDRVVTCRVSVTNDGPFPYRSLAAIYSDTSMRARKSPPGERYVAELKPGDTEVLDIYLTPEISDDPPDYFRVEFADNQGNRFVYSRGPDGERVVPKGEANHSW